MDREIFWDVFRDTGDPICWLLARMTANLPKNELQTPEQRERKPSVPC